MTPLTVHMANATPPLRRKRFGAHLLMGVALGWVIALVALYTFGG